LALPGRLPILLAAALPTGNLYDAKTRHAAFGDKNLVLGVSPAVALSRRR
jgi:hypothetical protein